MTLLTAAMKQLVEEQRLGYVATVCPDGTPSFSPKGTTAVWDDGHLVFADIASPQTIRNLGVNPVLEVNVVDPLLRKGFRFKGTGQVFAEGKLFEEALTFYRQRGVANPILHVVFVRVERALPLLSPVYQLGATEADVRRKWKQYWAALETRSVVEPPGE